MKHIALSPIFTDNERPVNPPRRLLNMLKCYNGEHTPRNHPKWIVPEWCKKPRAEVRREIITIQREYEQEFAVPKLREGRAILSRSLFGGWPSR